MLWLSLPENGSLKLTDSPDQLFDTLPKATDSEQFCYFASFLYYSVLNLSASVALEDVIVLLFRLVATSTLKKDHQEANDVRP